MKKLSVIAEIKSKSPTLKQLPHRNLIDQVKNMNYMVQMQFQS